jgi:hypothetical protein
MSPEESWSLGDRPLPEGCGVFIIAVLVAAFVLVMIAAARAHENGKPNWITEGDYRGPDNVHCCGPNDCFPISVDDISITPRGYVLKTYGNELVPFSSATPSEDKRYWRCRAYDGSRRCFFAPIGGS